MALLDQVAARVGRAAPAPRLRVVQEGERAAVHEERTARPEALEEFIGQESVTFNLTVECEAAAMDGRLPDHILLEGPAGLGKTSLAKCVAARLGVRFVEIPATSLEKVRDVANALARIGEPEDGPAVVFVDEVHGVCKKGQLLLLSALEDGWFQPSGAERVELPEFCMIAATTNPGLLSRPLRERFGIREALDYYDEATLQLIVQHHATAQNVDLDDDAAYLIAAVGRGTPRVASALLRRIAVFTKVGGATVVTAEYAQEALERLGIDDNGLDPQDRALLGALCGQSTPIGVQALAAQLGTDEDSITQKEPYLLRSGLIRRTGRGRVATKQAYRALGQTAPVWTP
jgi:Holliday junction DNA helicase RuvB